MPIATARQVRRYARRLAWQHRRQVGVAVLLHVLAASSGLAAPRLLGDLVSDVTAGTVDVTRIGLLILLFLLCQAVLVGLAAVASARLGERVLADIRTEFVNGVLRLPLQDVERAGTGDLVTRSTRDVDLLARAVRQAVPDTFMATTTIVLTLGAVMLVDPVLILPCLVGVPGLWFAARWYLARARDGYLRENASYGHITQRLAETVDGARTVEALRVGRRRVRLMDEALGESYQAQRYTLRLRTVFLPISDLSYVLPVAATLLVGGMLYVDGRVTLAAIITVTLYVQQLVAPVDVLLYWLNELQIGGASLARLVGVMRPRAQVVEASVPPPPPPMAAATGAVELRGVGFSYRDGHEVLRDVDLVVEPGETLVIVGPSGAGKSTLARLIAGVHSPSEGSVVVDGKPVAALPARDRHRHVALVTQEYHIFSGTLRDNLVMVKPDADDAELEHVMTVLGAWGWASRLGWEGRVGSGGADLSAAQGQQLALARVILADPQVVVLDEATAQLAPRAARDIERSLAVALRGRTIVAVAHRLHTSRDADRIVVMEHGRVVEFGGHADLVRRGGVYAELWRSWHGGTGTGTGTGTVTADREEAAAAGAEGGVDARWS
ncbi:MAG TPA: ABC transporter ATP-binding protein [Micromonosporaceae bacterium]|nr:ABC transporter ATP-binding protein [Micromonosporaceae bacterium]